MTRAADPAATAGPSALLAADWPAPPGVRAFTTLRHGAGVSLRPFDSFNLGVRAGEDATAVHRNRRLLVTHAGLPASPRWLRQVHGTDVWRFDGRGAARVAGDGGARIAEAGRDLGAESDAPRGDASVTSVPGVVLAVLTADCLPVVFAASDGSEIGAAHAGWRGLAAGVLEQTIAAMHTPAAALQAWLGPAAGPQAYEVGAEVRAAFVDHDAGAADAFAITRPGHWHVDLYALARRRLQAAGLAAERIHGGGLCTISDPRRFYSHRRDARTGRMATVVWRVAA